MSYINRYFPKELSLDHGTALLHEKSRNFVPLDGTTCIQVAETCCLYPPVCWVLSTPGCDLSPLGST